MANKSCTARISLTYTGPGNETVTPPAEQAVAPYQAQLVGTIDIPADGQTDDVIDIPFGSLTGATAMLLFNRSTQQLNVSLNTSATLIGLAPGGCLMIGNPTLPATTALSAASVKLTADASAVETVEFRLFGDPE